MGGHLETGRLGALDLLYIVGFILQEEPLRLRTVGIGLEQGSAARAQGTVHVEFDGADIEHARRIDDGSRGRKWSNASGRSATITEKRKGSSPEACNARNRLDVLGLETRIGNVRQPYRVQACAQPP